MKLGDNNVLVSLSLGKEGNVDFNIISSVYGKNNGGLVKWINDGKLRYADKEKALAYLSSPAPIAGATQKQGGSSKALDWLAMGAPLAPSQANQGLNSAAKVLKNFENPEISPKILQKMTVWHGSPHYISGGFDHSKINTGQGAQSHGWGTYVAKNKEIAEDYARYMAQPRNGIVVRFVGDFPVLSCFFCGFSTVGGGTEWCFLPDGQQKMSHEDALNDDAKVRFFLELAIFFFSLGREQLRVES